MDILKNSLVLLINYYFAIYVRPHINRTDSAGLGPDLEIIKIKNSVIVLKSCPTMQF